MQREPSAVVIGARWEGPDDVALAVGFAVALAVAFAVALAAALAVALAAALAVGVAEGALGDAVAALGSAFADAWGSGRPHAVRPAARIRIKRECIGVIRRMEVRTYGREEAP